MSSCNVTASPGSAGAAFTTLLTHLLAAQCLTEPWPENCADRVASGDSFDYIIVGAGTAGSLLAGRLVQQGQTVLLLEAGGDPPLESIIPNFSGATHKSKHAWQYYTEEDETTNRGCIDRRSFWPRGKVLGGTGSINGLLHMRGSPKDYAPWHHQENDGWDWPTIKQYFMKSEKVIDPYILNNPDLRKNHGTKGEFVVDQLNFTHAHIAERLISGYQELGLKYLEDMNGPTQMGVGKICGGSHKGRRVSTATAFLTASNNNLHILKNTFASKILINKDKEAEGVEVILENGHSTTFYSKKEIIVSAGTVNTPVLLMLSGIGPKEHLEEMGINVVVDLPVGENLQDHVRIPVPVTIHTGSKVIDDKYWLKAAAEYFIDQTGPHATNYDQPNLNAFLSVLDGKELPDVQIDHNYFLPNTSYVHSMCTNTMSLQKQICDQFSSFNSDKEMIIFFISLCRPYSRGKILLRSKNSTDHPKIFSKYFSDQRDMETFVRSLKRVMGIINTPTFKNMSAELKRIYFKDCDNTAMASDEYWECMARTITYNVYHPVGTAKMGKKDDPTAVVDGELKVKGVKSLRVVDASIMPTITSVNTNAPTMMIAERAADFIVHEYRLYSKAIKILEKGILPLEKVSIGIQFFIDIENEERAVSCTTHSWTKKCCLTDKETEDCDTMYVYSDNMNKIKPRDRVTLVHVYPTLVQHDQLGYCDFVVEYSCGTKKRKSLKVNIPFDTRIFNEGILANSAADKYIEGQDKMECDTLDQNSLSECSPVDCDLKYNGGKPFFDAGLSKCIKAAFCLGDPSKPMPDIVYVPAINVCRNLENILTYPDVYAISTGYGTTIKPEKPIPEFEFKMVSNCSTISQNLFLLWDLFTKKLTPVNQNEQHVSPSMRALYKTAVLEILACIIGVCAMLFSFVCCLHTTVWLYGHWSNGQLGEKWQIWVKKYKSRIVPKTYSAYSAVNEDVKNALLRDVIVKDIPIELRDSVVDICDRMGAEVRWKKRYRGDEIGSNVSLRMDCGTFVDTPSGSEAGEKTKLLKK